MGNQQERSLAWLGGIIDGEGTMSVQVYTMPNGHVRLTPFVCIVNSDPGIIAEVLRILDTLGIDVTSRYVKKAGGFKSVKDCINIRLDGVKRMRIFIKHVAPYLKSVKHEYAMKIEQYLDSRDKRGITRNALGHIRRAEYSKAEIDLIASVRTHKRAKSSEAICRALNIVE